MEKIYINLAQDIKAGRFVVYVGHWSIKNGKLKIKNGKRMSDRKDSRFF